MVYVSYVEEQNGCQVVTEDIASFETATEAHEYAKTYPVPEGRKISVNELF